MSGVSIIILIKTFISVIACMVGPNYSYKAKVTNVVDGDTIDVEIDLGFQTWQAHRLRFNRVNTREMRGTRGKEKELAVAATLLVTEKLLDQEIVVITTKSDAFGRYLAEILFIDEDGIQKNMCDILLETGLAVPYKRK